MSNIDIRKLPPIYCGARLPTTWKACLQSRRGTPSAQRWCVLGPNGDKSGPPRYITRSPRLCIHPGEGGEGEGTSSEDTVSQLLPIGFNEQLCWEGWFWLFTLMEIRNARFLTAIKKGEKMLALIETMTAPSSPPYHGFTPRQSSADGCTDEEGGSWKSLWEAIPVGAAAWV